MKLDLLLHCTIGVVLVSRSLGAFPDDDKSIPGFDSHVDWYTKYKSYPEYCSTPEQMEERSIPPLTSTDSRIGDTRLLHVSVLIRHGARTPWHGGYECWDGYWENINTGVWNCDLTTMMAPPTPEHLAKNIDHTNAPSFLFEKKYDGLMDVAGFPFENELHGTCMVGQLILQGYYQQWKNGLFLRDAYLYNASNDNETQDIRMRLLDTSGTNYKPWEEPHIYFRSDDEQRTLMSGQQALRGMLDAELREWFAANKTWPIIPLHTADKPNDLLAYNERVCPRLVDIKKKAKASKSYQDFMASQEVKEVDDFVTNELKGDPDNFDFYNCLLETVCTDRDLPEVIGYGTDKGIYEKMIDSDTQSFNRVIIANDNEYAKLGMAPLWTQIMKNVGLAEPKTKFALYSGHDTSISPLLASLGLWDESSWPPYASMVSIEVHEFYQGERDQNLYPSDMGFRLIYNGQILTGKIEGCADDAEICDLDVLLKLVDSMTTGQSCDAEETVVDESTTGDATTLHSLSKLIVGGVLGFVAAYLYLSSTQGGKRHHGKAIPNSDLKPVVAGNDDIEEEDTML